MSDTTGGIPFPFTTYGTTKGGCIVGKVYPDHETGKRFRFCQAHTAMIGTSGTAMTQYAPAVQVGATTFGIGTDDVSAGLDADNPIPLGLSTSACPESTSTVTYYFWAQTFGFMHTTLAGTTLASVPTNGDDDITLGDSIITAGTTDAAVNSVAAATATDASRYIGWAVADDTDGTNVVTVFCNMPG